MILHDVSSQVLDVESQVNGFFPKSKTNTSPKDLFDEFFLKISHPKIQVLYCNHSNMLKHAITLKNKWWLYLASLHQYFPHWQVCFPSPGEPHPRRHTFEEGNGLRMFAYSNKLITWEIFTSGWKVAEIIHPILLMVQKSGDHQLRLVLYPNIYQGFLHSSWAGAEFLPSTAFICYLYYRRL